MMVRLRYNKNGLGVMGAITPIRGLTATTTEEE